MGGGVSREEVARQLQAQKKEIEETHKKELNKLSDKANQTNLEAKKVLREYEQRSREAIDAVEKHGRHHCETLKASLKHLMINIGTNTEKLDETNNKLLEISKQIAIESLLIKQFEKERNNLNIPLLVLLGVTGSGKSSFCNRLAGDNSRNGDKGPFSVGKGLNSQTSKIQKQLCTIKNKINNIDIDVTFSIVDTPGAYDTNWNDTHHTNNLVTYLHGCGGVNAFLLFFNFGALRFDQPYQNLIKSYENLFGKECWKHVIIVGSKCDTLDDEDWPDKKEELRKMVMEKMELDEKEVELPAIMYSKRKKYYNDGTINLLNVIPKTKFNCEDIKSPLDNLIEEQSEIQNKVDILKKEAMKFATEKGKIEGQISLIESTLQIVPQMTPPSDSAKTNGNKGIIPVAVCILGDSNVGKSSIVIRFVNNEFDQHQSQTRDATLFTKSIELKNQDKILKFEICDTGGQERYRDSAAMYTRGASVIIIVYDITNQESFEHVDKHIDSIRTSHTIIAVVGNKVDLMENRQVELKDARNEYLAKGHADIVIETSAKDDKNINQLFDQIIDCLEFEKLEPQPRTVSSIMVDGTEREVIYDAKQKEGVMSVMPKCMW